MQVTSAALVEVEEAEEAEGRQAGAGGNHSTTSCLDCGTTNRRRVATLSRLPGVGIRSTTRGRGCRTRCKLLGVGHPAVEVALVVVGDQSETWFRRQDCEGRASGGGGETGSSHWVADVRAREEETQFSNVHRRYHATGGGSAAAAEVGALREAPHHFRGRWGRTSKEGGWARSTSNEGGWAHSMG